MTKTRSALRLGGALAIALAFLLVLTACSESSKTPDETVEVRLTGKSDALAAKALTVTNESYTLAKSGELYWTYTAVKADGYFTTGQTSSETWLSTTTSTDEEGNETTTVNPDIPSSLPGKFSVGDWSFTFNAYTSADMSEDSLYYQGTECSVTLSSGGENTVPVNVVLVTGETGTLEITVSGFENSDGTTADLTGSYTLKYTLEGGALDEAFDGTLTLNETATISISSETYTLTVYLLTDSGTAASQEMTVTIKPDLTTTVEGTLQESSDGTVTVYTGSYVITVGDGESYQYTYNSETGSYDKDYSVYIYLAGELYETVYLTASDDGTSFDLSSVTNGDLTLTSVTDADGNTVYDSSSSSTTITITEDTTLYYVWTVDSYTVSISLLSLSSYNSLDEDEKVTYSVTLTSTDDEEISYELVASESDAAVLSVSSLPTGTYTLSVAATDEDGDTIALYDEDGESLAATVAVKGSATLSLDAYRYPALYLEFVIDSSTAASSMDLFKYAESQSLLASGGAESGWDLLGFSVYTSTDGSTWSKSEDAANSISADSGTYVRIKLMDSLVFPVFHLYSTPVSEIVTMPTLGKTSSEAATSLYISTSYYSPFRSTTLSTVPSSLFKDNSQLTDLSYVFYNCTALSSIPEGIFDYNTSNTTFENAFYKCTSITGLPDGIFDANTKVTSFTNTFRGCTALASVDEDLFKNNTSVTTFYGAFNTCSALASIPEGLFAYNTAVESFYYTFYSCTSLTEIPEALFTNNAAVTTFYGTFYYCSSLTTVPEALFASNTKVTSFGQIFYRCSSLASVPENLFKYNTEVTTFKYAFSLCTSLTTVPSGLFKYNTKVTSFERLFDQCSALTEVPSGLFACNTAVTTFSGAFYQCTSLTTIPSNLFDACANVTSFQYTFYNCNSLAGIPSGLFTYNTKVTTFYQAFLNCQNIASIPEGLFDTNTAVTTFYNVFAQCYSLTTVPEKLFLYNTAVTNFEGTFRMCTSLSPTVYIGSEVVTNATNFAYSTATVYVKADTTTYTTFYDKYGSSSTVTVTALSSDEWESAAASSSSSSESE